MSCERSYTDPADPWGLKCNPLFDLNNTNNTTIENYVQEHLAIGGARLNVFKLLGIHEQGKLVDLTGNGKAISSGDIDGFPASNVFDELCENWRSSQRGLNVTKSAFIGYDFGPIRKCDRDVYGIDTRASHHITTIIIRQGENSKNRATKVRVERSLNGSKWYGVDILTLPDNDHDFQVSFKNSTASRYWRLRPLEFNGGVSDFWEVEKLQLFDFDVTSLDNIQDEYGFMESRDRDYAHESVPIKGHYDLLDARTELSKFGIDMSAQIYYINVSFAAAIQQLGRPFVIGDIIELPSEAQYTPDLKPVKKYLEVTDVSWSIEGYTPGWKPTIQRLVAEPVLASQETMDVMGEFLPEPDDTGFLDIPSEKVVDLEFLQARAREMAHTNTPEAGANTFDVADIPQEVVDEYQQKHGVDLSKISLNPTKLYVQDGLPPNGEKYTEGDDYPTSPKDGAYHRLTYTSLNDNIPPRLFRWSTAKGRWIYCETDRRQQYNRYKPTLHNMITDSDSVDNGDIQ